MTVGRVVAIARMNPGSTRPGCRPLQDQTQGPSRQSQGAQDDKAGAVAGTHRVTSPQ